MKLCRPIIVVHYTSQHSVSILEFWWFPRLEELCLGSVAGSVIQATGRTDFEDGSRTGTKLGVRNGLQSVRTIPEVNMVSPLGLSMTLGAVWMQKFLY